MIHTSSVVMIFSRGRRTTGRRAVTGRGIHSVTQYTASNGSIQTLKGKGKKSCHGQDNKGTAGLGGPDVEDERTEGDGSEDGEPGPPESEDYEHLVLHTGAA